MGNVSPGGKIQSISVDTHTAFTGGSQEATIEVGTTLDNDQLHGPTENDTTEVGTYILIQNLFIHLLVHQNTKSI